MPWQNTIKSYYLAVFLFRISKCRHRRTFDPTLCNFQLKSLEGISTHSAVAELLSGVSECRPGITLKESGVSIFIGVAGLGEATCK